jgi:predicted dehydrogenase
VDKIKVGIIGCGNIVGQYLTHGRKFPILDIVAVADMFVERAQAKAKEFNVPKACTVDELLADESIQLVINLTIPAAHAEIAIKAIQAGKHVLSEKPLGINREEGKAILAAAKKHKRRVGCAPDTFFGAGHQTARKAIDDGLIGRPVAATAYMMCRGHESWHPDPGFFYKPGGGPMLDMGPYYVTDLTQLLGPVTRVVGSAVIAIPERTITSQPKNGQKITVETPDHIAGNLEFASGAVATVITSFAVFGAENASPITIFGTEGTLKVPDPNGFDGEVKLLRRGQKDWETLPFQHRIGYGRSVGAADMAHAIRSGREHRASGERAFNTLDIMLAFLDNGSTGKPVKIKSKYTQPAPLPLNLAEGVLED